MTGRSALIDAAALEKHHEFVVFQKQSIQDKEMTFAAKIRTPDSPDDETAPPRKGYDSIWINVQYSGIGHNPCESVEIK